MMIVQALLVLLILTSLLLLGSSRLSAYIGVVAFQGALLGALTLAVHLRSLSADILLLALGSILLKSLVIPGMLTRASREADVRTAVRPYLGYGGSLIAGMLLLVCSLWLGSHLTVPHPPASGLAVPVALFMMFIGLFLIAGRQQALTQILGYLVLENGIYAFGVALVVEYPLWVELAILLDLLVAVLVMGVILFDINRDFDHIDTSRLSSLKD